MSNDVAISFSAISLMIWVMLWLLGIVRSMVPIPDSGTERSSYVVPGLLYGVALLIGFTVIMFVGFIMVPNAASVLLANIGMALLVVQAIIIVVSPYIVGITVQGYRKIPGTRLILVHIVGTLWFVWSALLMRLLVNTLAASSPDFNMATLLSTLGISILIVFLAYLEFMWITGHTLIGRLRQARNEPASENEGRPGHP